MAQSASDKVIYYERPDNMLPHANLAYGCVGSFIHLTECVRCRSIYYRDMYVCIVVCPFCHLYMPWPSIGFMFFGTDYLFN